MMVLLLVVGAIIAGVELTLRRQRRAKAVARDAATDLAMMQALAELDDLQAKKPAYDTPDYWRMVDLTRYAETQGGHPPGYQFRRIWR